MAIQKQKVHFFESKLADYFKKAGRDFLPWRRKGITAYEVWVSEIMLQQTQVSRVVGYYERFLKKFPTVEKLAVTTWEEFLPYYEGLGYYARGRNMLLASQKVVGEYRGVFPRDKELLQTLPGVGPYTAGAILSFAYGDNHLAWDTNLKRVIGRFFLGSKRASVNEGWFEKMFTTKRRQLNASLMDFGSSICVARPKCNTCPLKEKCLFYKEKGVQEVGTKKEREIFSLAEAEKVEVFLHEKHQRYFSLDTDTYRPFRPPAGYVTREAIKEWFLKEYGLKVAVRPSHARYVLNNQKVLWVNAQILDGNQTFAVFPKEAIQGYNKEKLVR